MTFIARQTDFRAATAPCRPAVAEQTQPQHGFWRRLYDVIMDGRQQRAQRDINRFVSWHSRNLTDSLEREIGTRMFTGDWSVRR
jgi:hypothetical protein